MDIMFVLRIYFLVFHLFFSYPLASKSGITIVFCSQAAIRNTQNNVLPYQCCHMLPQVFNLGMEWRYKTKIKYCYSYSTTLWKIVNNLYTSLLTGSLQ